METENLRRFITDDEIRDIPLSEKLAWDRVIIAYDLMSINFRDLYHLPLLMPLYSDLYSHENKK